MSFNTIPTGGWHFSYLGGVEKIKFKIKSFAHTEFNKDEYLCDKHLLSSITKGNDIFKRAGVSFKFNSLFSYPISIQNIMIRYPRFVHYPPQANILNKIFYESMVIIYKIIGYSPCKFK